jgi:hypothetical protein
MSGTVLGLRFFPKWDNTVSRCNPESNVMDGSGDGGFYFLLWGEPGLRWFWGVVLFFGFVSPGVSKSG